MLGIDDPVVLLAYVLCLASTVLCLLYGLAKWNKGQDVVASEDINWDRQEKKELEEEI